MPTRSPIIRLFVAALSVAAPAAIASPAPASGTPAMPMPSGQMDPGDMHSGNLPPSVPTSPASRAYMDAMMRMHQRMSVPMTGNADADFVRGMLPHHQGAVDMAEIELKYGSDPQLKRLARAIITAQKREIAEMERWLQQHPGTATGLSP